MHFTAYNQLAFCVGGGSNSKSGRGAQKHEKDSAQKQDDDMTTGREHRQRLASARVSKGQSQDDAWMLRAISWAVPVWEAYRITASGAAAAAAFLAFASAADASRCALHRMTGL